MSDNKNYTYKDFWDMRGRQSIWFTRNMSYRAGACIALLASKFGVTPNFISLLSGAITIFATMVAVYLGQGSWMASIVLILGLQLGYAFDCADGCLARATKQSSSFGILVDKLVDLSSGMIFPCILAYGAGHFYFNGDPSTVKVLITILILRVVHNVMMWMKEMVVYNADRLKEDQRKQTLWWKMKKMVSLYIDEPVYRFGVAVAWSVSWFWEFFIPYNCGILILSLVYLFASKNEMDEMDRNSE